MHEKSFWKKNRINLKKGFVTYVCPDNKVIKFDNDDEMSYDRLVIATGSKPNKFGWPGQDLKGVMGLYHRQDLENLEKFSKDCKRAVIVGGGLIGIELAEMLLSRGIQVTFLVRENSFWNGVLPGGESELINRHIREHHIDLRLETNLTEILADENGRARAVKTDKGDTIDCQVVGLTAGVSPNIEFLKNTSIETNRGVLVNRYLETSAPRVYAIGDCAEQREAVGLRRPVEAVWYTGRMMGETLAQTICGNKIEYKPGHWFNSAKFLDIEYQTYGWVFSKPKVYEEQFYWEHQDGKKCIRISYHKDSNKFLGINTFGIRMRHETFDKWLTEEQTADYVIKHLKEANFDPEFYRRHENTIQKAYELHKR